MSPLSRARAVTRHLFPPHHSLFRAVLLNVCLDASFGVVVFHATVFVFGGSGGDASPAAAAGHRRVIVVVAAVNKNCRRYLVLVIHY